MSGNTIQEDYRYELLDNQNRVLRTLGGVQPGGLLEESIHTSPRAGASLRIRPTEEIDWLRHRVRINYLLNGRTIPLLTGLPASPGDDADSTGVEMQLDLYDRTSILDGDSYGEPFAVPPGANLIEAVANVIASTGETQISIPASPATTATGIGWPSATTKLGIVNDLLTAAGYLTLWCDGLGWFRAEPYTPPSLRPKRFTFAGAVGDRYLPRVGRQFDPLAVPNRVRAIAKTDGSSEAAMAEAIDERPANPFSKLNRGFWRTYTALDIEASDLAGWATRRLAELQQVYEAHTVTHAWIDAGLNDAGLYHGRLAVLQKRRQRLAVGGLVVSTLRTVI